MKTIEAIVEVIKGKTAIHACGTRLKFDGSTFLRKRIQDRDFMLYDLSDLAMRNPHWSIVKEPKKRPITAEELIEKGAMRIKTEDGSVFSLNILNQTEYPVNYDRERFSIKCVIENGWKWSQNGIDWFSFEVEEQ